GIAEDISDRKRGEMTLQDQARYTQAILDNVIDGIITIDERGTVASLNQAAERIFGYPPGEVLGQNVKMLMPEPYHSEHDGYLANYRATGVERVIGIGREVVGRRKDGRSFPMDLAVSEISHAGRRMFVGLVRDITERKRVEQMKSEFVSTVSHELRTPLTSIAGALGLITGGAVGELPPPMKPLIDIAHKNSQRLIHLINDLLDMEKIAAGKMHFDMQLLALMPLVEQALEVNKGYGESRRVRFALTERVEDLEVRIDSQRLQQVMANFLSNAAKFSPEGGQVEVAVQRRGGRVRVSVRDYGPGIPDEFRTRIFEKFSQADSSDTRQKGGTGLGLAITRELIERMGGAVGYASVVGEGATFWIEVPIDKRGVDPAADRAGPASDTENSDAPRILVVEDDPDIAHLLQLMLTRAGYRSAVAESGEQALTLLADGDFAAMTLDLLLPGMSGLDVISRVRQNPATTDLPIIVVSATVEDGRLAIDGDFSTLDWLSKPLDEARLQSALERALPRARSDQPQRVLHVEDDVDMHQVIRAMVGNRFTFEHAASLSDARTLLAMERFDVVILDLTLPDGSGWELLPLIRAQRPEPLVIILSGTELSHAEAGKVEAALLKSRVSPRALLDAINTRITKGKEPSR
ncbi:MAG: response regulator, partial [Rhodocyclaceae bacterium]|nr:response regulator [Rhodocyclaceae bacterium]